MSTNLTTRNLALFCDFENVALGVRDAKYAAFDSDNTDRFADTDKAWLTLQLKL